MTLEHMKVVEEMRRPFVIYGTCPILRRPAKADDARRNFVSSTRRWTADPLGRLVIRRAEEPITADTDHHHRGQRGLYPQCSSELE
jgi:hypothetical protein